MTLAEIAAELRMSPATIRSWVSQGTLQATRAGKRKWLVRRSELDRVLAGEGRSLGPDAVGQTAPEGGWRTSDNINAPHRSPHWTEEARELVQPESWLKFVDTNWRGILRMSQEAPPDADFVWRIRTVAETAATKAAAFENMEQEPGTWWQLQKGLPNGQLSYELRPGATRPGPSAIWVRFDRCVEELNIARESHSVSDERIALARLSLVLHDIADELVDAGAYPWLSTDEYDRRYSAPDDAKEPAGNAGDEKAGEDEAGESAA